MYDSVIVAYFYVNTMYIHDGLPIARLGHGL